MNVEKTMQSTNKQDLVITRVFDAPTELVWRAWSEPEYVVQWWGPDGFTAPFARIDFREGATSFVCMSSPQFGDHYSLWHYQKIVPMQRIEFTHTLADKDGNAVDPTQVGMPPDFPRDQRQMVELKDLGNGQTQVTVTEYGWTVGQMMELSRMGMEQCLKKMAVSLERAQK